MKKKTAMIMGVSCLALMVVAAPFIGDCAEKGKPIVLKAVTFLAKDNPELAPELRFFKAVEERSNGQLIFDYIGGPESIPPPQQPVALQKGIVDYALTIPDFYWSLGPKDELLLLSEITFDQEGESGGVDDLLQEYHRRAGFFRLGRFWSEPNRFFRLWVKKPVKKPQDLAGLKIEGMGMVHHALVKKLGGAPVTLMSPDLYTAMERGVTDGIFVPYTFFFENSFYEVCKYGIDHPLFNDNTVYLFNLDSWNRIPKELQNLLRQVHKEAVLAHRELFNVYDTKKRDLMIQKGLKFIKFSPADAAWFVKTAYEAEWAKQLEKYPDVGPKLKEMIAKRKGKQ
jgi:TRAP-type C4-dicarboxylate transport system substrate-binding protein